MTESFFLVIGTYRAGTTWLQKIFEKHTQIFVPPEKELFYFSRYFDRGVRWYENFFKKNTKYITSGEICPSYLMHAEVSAHRINQYNSNTKIIAILRNPVEQIESMIKLHENRVKSFEGSKLDNEIIKEKYLDTVKYYSKLKPFYKLFDKEQILVLKYDDLKESQELFLEKIYTFLGVQSEFYQISRKTNAAFKPRSKKLSIVITGFGELLRKRNLYLLKSILNKLGVSKLLKALNSSEDNSYIKLSDQSRDYIYFSLKDDIKNLEELTNIDFKEWKS